LECLSSTRNSLIELIETTRTKDRKNYALVGVHATTARLRRNPFQMRQGLQAAGITPVSRSIQSFARRDRRENSCRGEQT
jgi:hypothetical protein